MVRIRGLAAVATVVCALALPASARANSFTVDLSGGSFSGVFGTDTDVALILFSLTDASRIDVSTTSFADGGFDPLLSLFSFSDPTNLSSGILLADNDDSDPDNGVFDARLRSSSDVDVSRFDILAAGLYGITVTEALNYSTGFTFGEGFSFDGNAPFVCEAACGFGGTLTITPVEQPAPGPEPGTLALMASGVGWLAARRRTRAPSSPN
jgi:hypothetical protein